MCTQTWRKFSRSSLFKTLNNPKFYSTDWTRAQRVFGWIFRLTRLSFNKVTSYWKRFDILYSIFGFAEKQQLMQSIAESKRQAAQVIENRRTFLIANGTRNSDAGKCFVDILLESTINGQTMNNQEILDEIQTVLIAVSIQIDLLMR